MDLAHDNIRVNSISPGWTWCRLMDELTHGDKVKTNKVGGAFHLLGRVGEPDEVAQGVLFLCSSHASFITGTDSGRRWRLFRNGARNGRAGDSEADGIARLLQAFFMKRIAIVGAGQSGLQLALGLLHAGYEVTLVSDRRRMKYARTRDVEPVHVRLGAANRT